MVPPSYGDWLRAQGARAGGLPIPEWTPDTAVAAMTGMYEAYGLDDAARHQIDRGTAETLFPRFTRSAA